MARYTTQGGNKTAIFEYTKQTAGMNALMKDAAEHLWEAGYGDHGTEQNPINFNSLSDDEKLAIVDVYVKQVIVDLANDFKSNKAQKTARDNENNNKHTL